MLHRVIYSSEAVGATGASALSVAQTLGVSGSNNRRDHITSCLMFHEGQILQVTEGARIDLDRLLRPILADPRHTDVRVLSDTPITARRLGEPVCLCGDPVSLLERAGLSSISRLTSNDAEAMLDFREAA